MHCYSIAVIDIKFMTRRNVEKIQFICRFQVPQRRARQTGKRAETVQKTNRDARYAQKVNLCDLCIKNKQTKKPIKKAIVTSCMLLRQ